MGFGLYCYPWDLIDEGAAAVYQRIRDWGINRLQIATTYHRFQAVLPHNPIRHTLVSGDTRTYYRRRDATDPELLFESDPRWSDDLAAAVELARDFDIKVSGWTIALHYAPWFRQFPQYSVRNLYGESFPTAVCPSHPDVRAFVKWLALDVAERLRVDEVELETPSWGRFFNPVQELHDRIGVSLGPLDELALSWCFCPRCTAAGHDAGIDVDSLVAGLRADLAATFASGSGRQGPLRQLFGERAARLPELAQYAELRSRTVGSMLADVQAACPVPVSAVVYAPLATGLDPATVQQSIAQPSAQGYTADTDDLASMVGDLVPAGQLGKGWRVALSLFEECAPSSHTLHRHLDRLGELGATDVSFYNYGLAPTAVLEQMGAAIRHYDIGIAK